MLCDSIAVMTGDNYYSIGLADWFASVVFAGSDERPNEKNLVIQQYVIFKL